MLRARGTQAFFAALTHELRTPLTSVRLQTEAIAEGEPSSELVERLLADTHRLESQIDKTLELARLEGGGSLAEQAIRLDPWLPRVLGTIAGTESENALRRDHRRAESAADLRRHGGGADDPAQPGRELGAPRRRRADRHRRPGASSARRRRGALCATTAAATTAIHERLGRLFQKGGTSRGTGMGLYLVRELMDRMGGGVRFGAAPGGGFEARLRFSGRRVNVHPLLMVEDDPNVASTLAERLRANGFDVTAANSVRTALAAIEGGSFQLALLDVGLPDGSGLDVARHLQRASPGTAIVFLTAYGTPDDRIQGLELGADDYVTKPFVFRELLLRVQQHAEARARTAAPVGCNRRAWCASASPDVDFRRFTAQRRRHHASADAQGMRGAEAAGGAAPASR